MERSWILNRNNDRKHKVTPLRQQLRERELSDHPNDGNKLLYAKSPTFATTTISWHTQSQATRVGAIGPSKGSTMVRTTTTTPTTTTTTNNKGDVTATRNRNNNAENQE
jgi:hypothetical protein